MPNATPFFSIVVPTYNRAHLIDKTIRTILNQEFTDFELIIVDDGSTDHTTSVVNGFTDSRIAYLKKENAERGAARNFGCNKSQGKYVNYFDSDDLMYPNHLQVAYQFIQEKNSPEFFHLGYDFKTSEGLVTRKVNSLSEDTTNQILFDNILSCNGVFLKRDVAIKFPFDENRVLASAEDWELWIRLICRYPILFNNKITTSVVGHDERSIRTIAIDKLVARDTYLVKQLASDPIVLKRYGKSFSHFVAERYTFIMLGLSESKGFGAVLPWAVRAFRHHFGILLTKRFWASIKNSLLV